jgi:hypothetical protein
LSAVSSTNIAQVFLIISALVLVSLSSGFHQTFGTTEAAAIPVSVSALSDQAVFPIKLTAVPNARTVRPGKLVNFTIEAKNIEKTSFNVTGYVLKVEPPQSKIYSAYNFPFGPEDPTIFPARTITNFTYVAKAGPTAQHGTYNFVIYWTGLANGTSARTHLCSFSLIVV